MLAGAGALLVLAAVGLGSSGPAALYLLAVPGVAGVFGALRRGRWRLIVAADRLRITGPRPVEVRFDDVIDAHQEPCTRRDYRLARPPRANETAETLVLHLVNGETVRICNLRLGSAACFQWLTDRFEGQPPPAPPAAHPWWRLAGVLLAALLVAATAVTVVLWRVDLFDGLF